ncbi:MAG: hypothetical protein ACE37E_12210 [Hyphomicrobiales bacterium]
MGEAKKKRRRHAKVLEMAKGCIYCASRGAAEQVDHMPPRAIFRMSQRPKGLEFPSCAKCNQGTSHLDMAAAFMARTFPGISSEEDSNEWDRVMQEVSRVAPDLLSEMWMPREEMSAMLNNEGITDPRMAAFRADGPILSAHMQAFGAKVGFALRFEDVGYPIPETGGAQVRWFTSGELYNGALPESLYASIGAIKIMRQGRITSDGAFEYGWGEFTEHPSVRLYYAKVREAFAVAAFVTDEISNLPFPADQVATFQPGDLSKPAQDRIYVN